MRLRITVMKKLKTLVKYFVVSLAGTLCASPVLAGVNCSVSPPAFTFPAYVSNSPSIVTLTSNLPVTCTTNSSGSDNVSYTVSFSAGNSGSALARVMKKGATNMSYNIYKNSSYTQVLGNGTGGQTFITKSYTFSVSRTDQYPIYGRIPASQVLPTGTYTDTIAITVEW